MKMKRLIYITAILLLGIGITGCMKKKKFACTDSAASNYDSDADYDDGGCIYTGTLVLWKSDISSIGDVDILVDNVLVGTITKDYSTVPGCAADSCVIYISESLQRSTYTAREHPPGNRTINFLGTLVTNECIFREITF